MRVLSDKEICAIRDDQKYFDPCEFARAIEAAVLERFEIAGFEPVEPYDETRKGAPLYRLRETK